MNPDTEPEVELRDVDLNVAEQEKQPMTAGTETGNGDAGSPATATEKNGSVSLKIPEETKSTFTGLSKDELLRVAGTPGWVRTRWALLILFWLGWLGMLAGAVAIIIQAPGCKPLPEMSWWNYGPLYQVGDVRAFTEAGNIKGVEEQLGSLGKLKVKGLVLGPLHVAPADEPEKLRFEEVSPDAGTLEQLKSLIAAAHKKSMSVVLDLTPNYQGSAPWFSNVSVTNVAERLKSALVFWLEQGVDGVQLAGVERVSTVVPSLWTDIRTIVQKTALEDDQRKVLIGVTERTDPAEVSILLNSTGVDLLVSGVVRPGAGGWDLAAAVQELLQDHNQTKLAWNLGGRTQGHLASLAGPDLLGLYQMMLLTLPGTPVFNYGDEIGLEDEADSKFPTMLWDPAEEPEGLNATLKEEMDQRSSRRTFFRTLADLRGKERSLQHGDYHQMFNSSSALAYLRRWDQSERYIAAFNWGSEPVTLALAPLPGVPKQAAVKLRTEAGPADPAPVKLAALELGAKQAVLLQFPYTP